MPVIKNIILDWSGTLVDDFPPVLEATNSIFHRYGKPGFTAEEFRQKFFLPFPDFYRQYLPEVSMHELDGYYHNTFQFLQEGIPLLSHALEFLEYCHGRGMPMFLLSTIHSEHFRVQGRRLGVDHFFKQAYVQALDKRKTILELLAAHQLEPAETLFIGDMMHDIETARYAGVVSCGVLTGYDPLEKLKSANPDLLFRHLDHVKHYLERHREEVSSPLSPVSTVGALIFNSRNEVLMVRTYKWSNRWGIPGGKIKGEESSLDALHREVLEETALPLEDVRFAMVQDCIRSDEFYKQAHFLLLNYVAWTDEFTVVLNDEADAYKWVTMEEAASMDLNKPTRVLLEYVIANPDLMRKKG